MNRDIVANPGLSIPLGLAAVAWVYLAGALHLNGGLPLCIGGNGNFGAKVHSALAAQWALLDQRSILSWVAMVVAMMLPITATHLSVAVAKCVPRFRWHVLAAALAGYVSIWLLLGVPYVAGFLLAAAVESVTPWPVIPLLLYGVAIAWCFAPLRQKALRRCHPVPAFFGSRRDQTKAASVWGAKLALYCATVCFLAMSAPMLSGQGLAGMLMATHVLLAERRHPQAEPRLAAIPLCLLAIAAVVQHGLT